MYKVLLKTVIFIFFITTLFIGCKKIETSAGEKNMSTVPSEIFDNSMEINKLSPSEIKVDRLKYPYDLEGTFSSTIHLHDIRSQYSSLCLRCNKNTYYGVIKIKNDVGFQITFPNSWKNYYVINWQGYFTDNSVKECIRICFYGESEPSRSYDDDITGVPMFYICTENYLKIVVAELQQLKK